jgi:hypothetical protein
VWYCTDENVEQVAEAAGISRDTSEFELTDAYGYTYEGTRAVRVLSALARTDITPTLSHRVHAVAFALLAALQDERMPIASITRLDRTPFELVALVTYLCRVVEAERRADITEWIIRYHRALAALPLIPHADRDCPPFMIDYKPDRITPQPLVRPAVRRAADSDDADAFDWVTLRVKITHSETIQWSSVRDLDVPSDRVNHLLADPDALVDFVEENGWSGEHDQYDNSTTVDTSLDDVVHIGLGVPLTYPQYTEAGGSTMIDVLRDLQENAEIAAAQRAVAASERHLVQLHIAALARIVRLGLPNAAALVVDATYACDHNESSDVILIAIYDAQERPLWTARSDPAESGRIGVGWTDLLDALHHHLAEAFNANDPTGFGWDEVPGTGRDTYALELPPTPSAGTILHDERQATASE